jgi:hypothetical protein
MPPGHGHELPVMQLQVRVPLALGGRQTQKPVFSAPGESRNAPPSMPCMELQTVQYGTSHGIEPCGVTPAGQAVLAVVGIL